MFESILVRPAKHEKVSWNNVKFIDILEEGEEKYTSYEILKGAEAYLHKKIDIKPGTSREVFKKSEDIWQQLKNKQLDELSVNPESREYFSLNKDSVIYLVDEYHDLIDVFDAINTDGVKQFNEALEQFKIELTTQEKTKKFFTDGKGGLTKLVCYASNSNLLDDKYTPVVMMEFNNIKSSYKIYTGILIYSTFTFIPAISSYMECNSYSDLVKSFDMGAALEYSTNGAEQLYDAYKNFEENPLEISARELITLLKKVGYKLELKDDDQLDTIENISDEDSNKKIQDFFNTFRFTTGESALDIMSLPELRKIFRYNKLTMLDMLRILSKEYLTYDGSKITTDILCSIVYNLFDKKNDKRQADTIREEITE